MKENAMEADSALATLYNRRLPGGNGFLFTLLIVFTGVDKRAWKSGTVFWIKGMGGAGAIRMGFLFALCVPRENCRSFEYSEPSLYSGARIAPDKQGWLRFVVSHPFRITRGMDGARRWLFILDATRRGESGCSG